MEIDFLILADTVEAVNGKLYMMGGGWNQLTIPQFPAPIRLGIALGLLVPSDNAGQKYQLQLTISDLDKRLVIQVQAEIGVGPPPKPDTMQRAILALNFGFSLPQSGVYRVLALVDSSLKRETSFEAVLVVPSQGG